MAKFKPVKAKQKTPAVPRAGVPCLILLVTGMLLIMMTFYLVLKNYSR